MKEFLIGRYQLGWRMVSLFADPNSTGAWFNLCRHREEAQIHVGMDYWDAAEAFGCLCHEVWEMSMEEAVCCYRPKAFETHASDLPHFFFNHNQHTEITAKSAFFIWKCINDFKKAHAMCRKTRNKK